MGEDGLRVLGPEQSHVPSRKPVRIWRQQPLARTMDLTLKTEKHHARVIDWVGGNDNFAVAGQRQRDGDLRPRLRERASSRAMVRAAYWAAKLLPHARCRRSN